LRRVRGSGICDGSVVSKALNETCNAQY
jgi:hypothetical protein